MMITWQVSKGKKRNGGPIVTCDEQTSKAVCSADGSIVKVKVPMMDATLPNGQPQPLYFPANHPIHPGLYKGMAQILMEQGINIKGKLAECKQFKCQLPAQYCCCCHILFNQPDFVNIPSTLVHCELNFIEQCWGYAKRIYSLNPDSSCEEVLEQNALEALESIPLATMQWYVALSHSFNFSYHLLALQTRLLGSTKPIWWGWMADRQLGQLASIEVIGSSLRLYSMS